MPAAAVRHKRPKSRATNPCCVHHLRTHRICDARRTSLFRTNAAGSPEASDSAVTTRTPPSSSPARTSVPSGVSGTICSATCLSRAGSPSKRYLSKYVVAVWPELSSNCPVSRQEAPTWCASSDRVFDTGHVLQTSGDARMCAYRTPRRSLTRSESPTPEAARITRISSHRACGQPLETVRRRDELRYGPGTAARPCRTQNGRGAGSRHAHIPSDW